MKYLSTDKDPIKYFIQVEAKAYINIPDHEFNALYYLCKHHYDHSVKSMAMVGGILYGAKNSRDFHKQHNSASEDINEIEFTSRKLQLALKAIEMDTAQDCYKLSQVLYKAFQDIQKVQTDLNKQLLEK